jgi:hypothetical protein
MTQTTVTKQYAYQKARGFMAEQLKQVNDRPAMPEALCLKLVQSLIDDGISFDAKIGVVDSTPILALYLKEAGFTNLTFLNNKEAGYLKSSRRVWLDDVKGFCTNNKIRTLTFDPNMSSKPKFDVIIGNPPYGHSAGLAIKFLNIAFELSEDVRFVLPLSISRPHCMNRIRLDAEPALTERLPEDTFPSNIQACYQVWKPGQRQKVARSTTHEDWVWLPYERRAEADLLIRISGTLAGKIVTKDEAIFDARKEAHNNHFVQVVNPDALDRFVRNREALIQFADSCNGRAKANKSTVVDFYSNHAQ